MLKENIFAAKFGKCDSSIIEDHCESVEDAVRTCEDSNGVLSCKYDCGVGKTLVKLENADKTCEEKKGLHSKVRFHLQLFIYFFPEETTRKMKFNYFT